MSIARLARFDAGSSNAPEDSPNTCVGSRSSGDNSYEGVPAHTPPMSQSAHSSDWQDEGASFTAMSPDVGIIIEETNRIADSHMEARVHGRLLEYWDLYGIHVWW